MGIEKTDITHEGESGVRSPEQEEAIGLERYYSEIVPDSLCENNFVEWNAHLLRELAIKYPLENEREETIERAAKFAKTLPLFHGTNLENLVSISKTRKLRSNFICRGSNLNYPYSGNTTDIDRANELDHFVYLFLGYPVTEFPVEIFFRQDLLNNPKVRVALEDYGWGTTHRLAAARDQNMWPKQEGWTMASASPEEAFEIQKSQIWKGPDFQKLLPLMLALAYENPEDFNHRRPFSKNVIPDGHLPVVERWDSKNNFSGNTFFPKFEIRVPDSVDVSDNALIVYSRGFEFTGPDKKLSKIEEDMLHAGLKVFKIPPTPPKAREEIIRNGVLEVLHPETELKS